MRRGNSLYRAELKTTELSTLAIIKPTAFQNTGMTKTGLANFSSLVDIDCRFLSKNIYSFCFETEYPPIGTMGVNINKTEDHVWNLGSALCVSNYQKVCDQFLIAGSDADEQCAEPGCGNNQILDLQTLKCENLSLLVAEKVTETNDLPWPSAPICSYRSSCKSVELGLLKEYELNCYCDQQCMYYNDCCDDSLHQPTSESRLSSDTFQCVEDRSELRNSATENGVFWGLMEVNGCPEGSKADDETVRRCNNPERSKIGIDGVPVSDIITGIR